MYVYMQCVHAWNHSDWSVDQVILGTVIGAVIGTLIIFNVHDNCITHSDKVIYSLKS
jgi:hypothetical protein